MSAVEKDHSEDEIIKLERTGDKLRGSFWVTSDEFVSGREGYLPGFTVLGMQNLVLAGDSISFLLDSHLHKFFSAPLCLDISSDKEAGRDATNGYKSQSSLLILSSTEESSVGIPCTWTRPRTSGAASL